MEQQLAQKECEVNSLKEQLALSKKNVQEFRDMAQITERQLAEVNEAFNKYKEEATARFVLFFNQTLSKLSKTLVSIF